MPNDASVLAGLNGFTTRQAMQARGMLAVPVPVGRPVPLDLDGPCRDRNTLIEAYWRVHPRYLFVKQAPRGARLADIGAGYGGMVGWKTWGAPNRNDLAMYAVDIEKGERFDAYADFDLVEVGPDETKYPDGFFEAVVCSHVLNCVADPDGFVREVSRIVRPGGRVYVEWLAKRANAISRKAFEPFGIECATLSLEDDVRLVAAVETSELYAAFERGGCRVNSHGVIENDFLYPELFRSGVRERDSELTTYGLWLLLRVAEYAIFEKAPGV